MPFKLPLKFTYNFYSLILYMKTYALLLKQQPPSIFCLVSSLNKVTKMPNLFLPVEQSFQKQF